MQSKSALGEFASPWHPPLLGSLLTGTPALFLRRLAGGMVETETVIALPFRFWFWNWPLLYPPVFLDWLAIGGALQYCTCFNFGPSACVRSPTNQDKCSYLLSYWRTFSLCFFALFCCFPFSERVLVGGLTLSNIHFLPKFQNARGRFGQSSITMQVRRHRSHVKSRKSPNNNKKSNDRTQAS